MRSMSQDIRLNHIALQSSNKEKSEIFFTRILGIPRIKSFSLSEVLSNDIFGINHGVEVDVYDNGKTRFEVFIGEGKISNYEHICIEVFDKDELINRCQKHGLNPLIIKRDRKDLLFIKDFSDNLYEIKEKREDKISSEY